MKRIVVILALVVATLAEMEIVTEEDTISTPTGLYATEPPSPDQPMSESLSYPLAPNNPNKAQPTGKTPLATDKPTKTWTGATPNTRTKYLTTTGIQSPIRTADQAPTMTANQEPTMTSTQPPITTSTPPPTPVRRLIKFRTLSRPQTLPGITIETQHRTMSKSRTIPRTMPRTPKPPSKVMIANQNQPWATPPTWGDAPSCTWSRQMTWTCTPTMTWTCNPGPRSTPPPPSETSESSTEPTRSMPPTPPSPYTYTAESWTEPPRSPVYPYSTEPWTGTPPPRPSPYPYSTEPWTTPMIPKPTKFGDEGTTEAAKKQPTKCPEYQIECGVSKDCCNTLDCWGANDGQEGRCLTSRRCIRENRVCNENSTFDECCGGTRCVKFNSEYRCAKRVMAAHNCSTNDAWCSEGRDGMKGRCCEKNKCEFRVDGTHCVDGRDRRKWCARQSEACTDEKCCDDLVCIRYYENYTTCEDRSVIDLKSSMKCKATEELCDGKCCATGHCRRREGSEAMCESNLCLNEGYECETDVFPGGFPSCCPGLQCDRKKGLCVEPTPRCTDEYQTCGTPGDVGIRCCTKASYHNGCAKPERFPRYDKWHCGPRPMN